MVNSADPHQSKTAPLRKITVANLLYTKKVAIKNAMAVDKTCKS